VLTITQNAADAIRTIVDSSDLESGAGLRISAAPVSETEARLELTLAEGPAQSDEVIEENDASVFLEPAVAQYLEDKVLGAEVQEDQVRFTIEERPAT
jgi:iron-sulfur cluster assembly protein